MTQDNFEEYKFNGNKFMFIFKNKGKKLIIYIWVKTELYNSQTNLT